MKIRYSILLVLVTLCAKAQQDAMFTHYMNNTLSVNPAYAGTRNALTLTGLHRSQWVGFEGAPVTQTITVHSPIIKNKMGLGISLINDKIGPVNTCGAQASYSYYIDMGDRSKLAMGLNAGVNMMQAGLTDLTIIDADDQALSQNINSKLLPNFGFGLYYRRPSLYVGLSAPRLLENNYFENSNGSTTISKENRHYYLIGGLVTRLSPQVNFKPTALLKATVGAPIEADITATFIFNKRFLMGGMVRSNDALGILAGYYITPQLHAGYSYDWSYNLRTFKYNQGSHEVMLSYDLIFKNEDKIRSPRYF